MAASYPGYNGAVPRENGFLSEMLVREGYATFAVGKWHLTLASEYASGASKARWPLARGFERYYGFLGGKTNQWAPTLVRQPLRRASDRHRRELPPECGPGRPRHRVRHRPPPSPRRSRSFSTTASAATPRTTSSANGSTSTAASSTRAGALARGGLRPPARDGHRPARHRAVAAAQWVPAWDGLSPDERRLYSRQMEVYAAFLEQTDHHVGRVISYLEQLGELENTLIMVTSDNGARLRRWSLRLLQRPAVPNQLQPSVAQNLEHLDNWGGVKSYPNYAWGWAWAGNTPLRRWKRYLHQGGMSDALIVHWPKGIAGRGELQGQFSHVIDVVPTVLEALGIGPGHDQRRRPAADRGRQLRPTFDDAAAPTMKAVQYYEMIGSRAIWHDGWKAVAEQEQGVALTEADLATQRWELYHVAEDFSESHDLAAQHPEKLAELVERWWAEAAQHNVLPLDARMQARMAERKPLAARDSSRYIYYRRRAQFEYTAVNLKNRSHDHGRGRRSRRRRRGRALGPWQLVRPAIPSICRTSGSTTFTTTWAWRCGLARAWRCPTARDRSASSSLGPASTVASARCSSTASMWVRARSPAPSRP